MPPPHADRTSQQRSPSRRNATDRHRTEKNYSHKLIINSVRNIFQKFTPKKNGLLSSLIFLMICPDPMPTTNLYSYHYYCQIHCYHRIHVAVV